MISTKRYVGVDGTSTRFLSDFIIRSESHVRVYAYVYDANCAATSSCDTQTAGGLYIRQDDAPQTNDLQASNLWDLVDNSIIFYTAPEAGATITIEVATTPEEFGDAVAQPLVVAAQAAADAAAVSETNAAASEAAAASSATDAANSAASVNSANIIHIQGGGGGDPEGYTDAQLDGGQLDNRYYTETEMDTTLSTRLSSIAASYMMNGTLALSNTVNTEVFDTTLYTGNGTSQSIVTNMGSVDINYKIARDYLVGELAFDRTTFKLWESLQTPNVGQALAEGAYWTEVADGVVKDHDSSRVWIKSRSQGTTGYTGNNLIYNTLQGATKATITNSTVAEQTYPTGLTSFDTTGFTVGAEAQHNTNLDLFVAWQQTYNKVVIGTTNHGKRYITAFDATTNRSMTLYQGSGVAGHEVPHHLGTTANISMAKNLDDVAGMVASLDNSTYMFVNSTAAAAASTTDADDVNVIYNGTGLATNTLGDNYIMYSEASSNTIKIGTYVGTGATGNKIVTGFKPSKVIIKLINDVENWQILDNKRGGDKLLQADSSAAETTASLVEFNADGFTLLGSVGTNQPGGTYLYIAYADSNSDGGGSYEDLPSATTHLNLTSADIMFSEGYDTSGAKNSAENIASATPTSGLTLDQGNNYIKRVKGTSWGNLKWKPVFGLGNARTEAGQNPDVYVDGIWYNSSNGDELTPDYSFDTGITNWTANNAAVLTHEASSSIKIAANITDYPYASRDYTLTVGKEYRIIAVVTATNTTSSIAVDGSVVESGAVAAPDVLIYDFVATNATTPIWLYVNSPSDTAYVTFGSVSVFEKTIEPDTAYATPITYLPEAVEADASGNVVAKHDADIPQFAFDHMEVDKARIKDLTIVDGFDLGQTWVNVTSERAISVEYINDTGKPLEISVYLNSSAVSQINILINNTIAISDAVSVAGIYTSIQGTIPVGATYKVSVNTGTPTLGAWTEKR